MSCGQSVLCAPDRIESPITSTSSWTAAEAIISGVWRKPVYITSMPFIYEAVKAYATLGEVCEAMRAVFGAYEEVAIT